MKLQMMKINYIFLLAIVLLISQFASCESIAQSSNNDCRNYENTRQLLTEMNRADPNKQFIELFNTGDKQIDELIKALNDSDQLVRRNAQIMIRYLGNGSGMSALVESYRKESASIVVAGPIPIPLSEWDYNYIKSYKNLPSTSYVYALALDSSAKAKAVLRELTENAKKNPDVSQIDLEKANTINSSVSWVDSSDLAKTVLDKSFFVSQEDKKFTTSKLIAFNYANNKALIEVHINRGVLSEEIYHVVIKKDGNSWKFLSITKVAVS